MIFLIIFAALCCCIAVRTLYCTAKVTCDPTCSITESRLNIEPAYFTRAPPVLQHKPNCCLHSCTPAPVSVSREGTETGVATPDESFVAQCVRAFAPRTKMHEKSCFRRSFPSIQGDKDDDISRICYQYNASMQQSNVTNQVVE